MNTPSKNSWVTLGQSYKATTPEKSWDSLRMRLENKKLKNRMDIYKKISIAALFFAVIGVVTIFYLQNSNPQLPLLAQKSNDVFELENLKPMDEPSIYNMSELKGLRTVYENQGLDTPSVGKEI